MILSPLQIGFKMFGVRGASSEEIESDPRRLWDPEIDRFQSGGEDSFVMSTSRPLGRLTHVDIWHDNSGASPDW